MSTLEVFYFVLFLTFCLGQEEKDEIPDLSPTFKVESGWQSDTQGGYVGQFKIQVDVEIPSWQMALVFPQPVYEFEAWQANYIKRSVDDRIVYIEHSQWNGHQWPGMVLDQRFLVQYHKQPNINYAFTSGPKPDIIFLENVYSPDAIIEHEHNMTVIPLANYTLLHTYEPIEVKTVAISTTTLITRTTITPAPGQEDNPWWWVKTTLPPKPTDKDGNVVKPTTNPYAAQISTTTKKPVTNVIAVSCPDDIKRRSKKCKKAKRPIKRCFLPQCTFGTKRFKAMQCWKFRGYCWCVDPRTGSKIDSTMVKLKRAHTLNCVDGVIEKPEEERTTQSTLATTTLSTIPYVVDSNQERPSFAPRNSYDYSTVIANSGLFFEAQRSGKLTQSRVAWRRSSHLKDGQECQKDLTGGYYVSGGYMKFGYPAAASITMLAWGYLEAKNAYDASGQTKYLKETLKWGTDYFMKAHTSQFEFYGQVGNADLENKEWARPQDMKISRPCYAVSTKSPGSDLAAETAAALAATAAVWISTGAPKDDDYVSKLLKHAKELYIFADRYRGLYSSSIRAASLYYPSSDYVDELVWGALWLYKATGDRQYLLNAQKKYNEFNLGNEEQTEFSWDRKTIGVQILLSQITKSDIYLTSVKAFCDFNQPGGGAYFTPLGLLFSNEWGSTRYACNAAFICAVASKLPKLDKQKQYNYRKFAEDQMDYILGKSGKSFVVGYGSNFPDRPHHRSSTCSLAGPCNWDIYHEDKPNAQILLGALVGGPDENDVWSNDRTDFKSNGVGLDYNAGLQSAAAILGQFQLEYKAWFDAQLRVQKNT